MGGGGRLLTRKRRESVPQGIQYIVEGEKSLGGGGTGEGESGVEEDRLYKREMEPIREVRLHEDVERINLKTLYAFFVVVLLGFYPSPYRNTFRISLLVFFLYVAGSVCPCKLAEREGVEPSKTTAKT